MCDIITKVWNREKPEDLQKSRNEEISELNKKKHKTVTFTSRIHDEKGKGQDVNNFVP